MASGQRFFAAESCRHSTALRATLPERLPLPMYAVITVYPRNNQLTAIALVCPDVDKKFWQPVYAQMLSALKETP